MKKIVTTGFLLLALIQVRAEGITFSSESWNQMLQQAKASNKIIFVDFYATWCGPCKHLEREIFTQSELGGYFNEHFISKRIDAEKEELELVGKMNIQAYPTLVFFDPSGEILYRLEGAPEVDHLLRLGKKALNLNGLKNNNSWKTNPDSLAAYLEALATHEPAAAEKIASTYLASLPQEELTKDENWNLLGAYVNDVTNPSWQYPLKYPKLFLGKSIDFASCVEKLAVGVMEKAVAAKNPKLLVSKTDLDLLSRKVQGDSSTTREEFQLWNTMTYLEKIQDYSGYAAKLNVYVRKYNWKESGTLTYYATKIFSGEYGKIAIANATQWAEHALLVDAQNYVVHWVLAIGYGKVGNMSKANASLQKFLKSSQSDPELPNKIYSLLN